MLTSLIAAACGSAAPTDSDTIDGADSVPDASTTTTTEPPLDVVTIAARSSIDASPIWIADVEGFFAAHGIEIVFVPVADEPAIFAAIASGEARAGVVSATAAIERQQRSRVALALEVYLDATDAEQAEERGSISLVGAENTSIVTGCDLVGKRIGVDSESSLSGVAIRQMVINDGCDPFETELVISSSTDRLTQLSAGDLDAAAFLDPDTSRALRSSTKLIANLDNQLCPDSGRCPLSIVAVREDWRGANSELVLRFGNAIEEAIAWINGNEIEYRAALVSCCAMTSEDAAEIRVPEFVVDRNLQSDMTRLRSVVVDQVELKRARDQAADAAADSDDADEPADDNEDG